MTMSYYNFAVNPNKIQSLQQKMNQLNIRETDIQEQFIHSSGPGGQNVNKVATGVYLKHLPTGIEVKCQKERSQNLNRFIARRMLVEKFETLVLGRASQKQQEIEKIRRQKRKRSKRAKEKMLQAKHHRSEIKQNRGSVEISS